ncbi:MAG: hypothetical protein AAF371_05580 [Pseudomonadota bacterium]
MADRIQNLKRAVRVLSMGARFYESAARCVNPRLAERFRAIAAERREAAEDIGVRLDALGADVGGADLWARLVAWYGRVIGWLYDGNDAIIMQLADHEDRTIRVMRGALETSSAAPERRVIEKHLAKFRESRDLMKGLREAG